MSGSSNRSKIPAPPVPNVSSCTHSTIELEWKSSLQKLLQIFPDSKIASEVVLVDEKANGKDKKRLYIGYASNFPVINLSPKTSYVFRLRFKVNEQWCPFSDPLTVSTEEHPITGEDIHKAVRSGNIETLKTLLDKNPRNIDVPDGLGFTPLMVAAQRGLTEVMQTLLESGADVEARTESGKSTLMLSSFKGEYEAIDTILEWKGKFDINGRDRAGMTALHYAVDGENPRAIRMLVSAGADVDIADKILYWSPIMRCAGLKSNGKENIAKELIKFGARIDLQDKEGNTPLHTAFLNGHINLCEVLLNHSANLDITNKRNFSVKMLVRQTDNIRMKTVFEDHLPCD